MLVPERLLGSHFQVRDNLGRMVAQGQLVDVRMEWAVQMPTGMYTLTVEEGRPVRWLVK